MISKNRKAISKLQKKIVKASKKCIILDRFEECYNKCLKFDNCKVRIKYYTLLNEIIRRTENENI